MDPASAAPGPAMTVVAAVGLVESAVGEMETEMEWAGASFVTSLVLHWSHTTQRRALERQLPSAGYSISERRLLLISG